jgi:hypothetical protein
MRYRRPEIDRRVGGSRRAPASTGVGWAEGERRSGVGRCSNAPAAITGVIVSQTRCPVGSILPIGLPST